MTRSVTLFFAFALFIMEVSTWTLNYPEVEKYSLERKKANRDKAYRIDNDDSSTYAKEYEYHRYREEQINDNIIRGSKYLDGLSQALSEYKDIMDRCSQRQLSTVRPIIQLLGRRSEVEDSCSEVLKNGEYIQRLSEIVMWTTSAMRSKSDQNYKEEDETALIARLAWLLDRLSYLTGFELSKNSTNPDEKSNHKPALKDSALEIMEPTENGRPLLNFPPKSRQKRSTLNPFNEVANYYIKYKAWTNSNPERELFDDKLQFDVENYLKVKPIQKRSVKSKKAVDLKVIDNKKTVILRPELIKAKLILHKIVDIGLKVKDKIRHAKKAIKHL